MHSLSFFAGWSWVVVARHLASLVGRQLTGDSQAGEVGCVVLLGPLLTGGMLHATWRYPDAARDGSQMDMALSQRIRAQRLRRKVVSAFLERQATRGGYRAFEFDPASRL
jgi:hypothetical protein